MDVVVVGTMLVVVELVVGATDVVVVLDTMLVVVELVVGTTDVVVVLDAMLVVVELPILVAYTKDAGKHCMTASAASNTR